MSDPYGEFLAVLRESRRVVITTHVRPDGDALGTAATMSLGLKKAGIASEVLLLSHMPRKYEFIFHDAAVPYRDVEAGWPADFTLNAFDTFLVVDTGTWSQLPGLAERVEKFPGRKLVLDHHLTQEQWADAKLVVTEAAAAGEIAAQLLDRWGIEIDRPMATALFLAIASDTGWFQFSNTRPYTLRLAARLMEAGVNTDRMYQLLYQNERYERVALQTRAQDSLELLADGRLAVMRVTRQDFEETHANVPDTENLINIPLQIRTVEVSLLFTEPKEANGPIRVSLRSKGQVDVARFAEQFGGGGHARASGLKVDGSIQHVHDRVVNAMIERMAVPSSAASR